MYFCGVAPLSLIFDKIPYVTLSNNFYKTPRTNSFTRQAGQRRVTNSQAAIHETRFVRCFPCAPGFSQSVNSKCVSAQQLFIAGKRSAEELPTIDVGNLGHPLLINSLDLHHTQIQQGEILN